MHPNRASRVRQLFEDCLHQPQSEAARILDRECEGDAGLRAEVESLLGHAESPTPGLEWVGAARRLGWAEDGDGAGAREQPGQTIGRYRLVRVIGEGGFGSVWLADQKEPVARSVALKIIRLGMDTRQVIARFEQERQALALMDHPGIAKVFDAGATDTGRPYFVMEFVPGEPITDFCDKQGMPIEGRLGLFTQVCSAVQHAHTKGIIHRDIKPSNVLVAAGEDGPLVKVIDFGVAKAIADPISKAAVTTQVGLAIGTPDYMSPEQARGQADIDTRTDVYGLGVLLYELLCGARPFDASALAQRPLAEVRSIIEHREPPRASDRLRGLSGQDAAAAAVNRGIDPARHVSRIRGELDWVLAKAIDRDRERRYETPADLARELRRILAGQAVQAAPPSATYRLRKFVRGHRMAVSVTAIVGATVLAAAAVSVGFAVSENRARQQAAKDATEAHVQLARFRAVEGLMRSTLGAVDPRIAQGRDTTLLRLILNEALRRARVEAPEDPAVAGVVLTLAGSGLRSIADFHEAERALAEACDILTRVRGAEAPETLDAKGEMGMLLWRLGRYPEAESLQRDLLATRVRIETAPSPRTAAARMNLATTLWARGRFEEAEGIFASAHADLSGTRGPDDAETLSASYHRAVAMSDGGKEREALPILLDVLDRQRAVLGTAHMDTAMTLHAIGATYWSLRQDAEAERYMRESIDALRPLVGDRDPELMVMRANLGAALINQRRFADAAPLLEETLAVQRAVFGDDHDDTASTINNLAACYLELGRPADAAPLLEIAAGQMERTRGPNDPDLAAAYNNLGKLNADLGNFDKAEKQYRKALAMSEASNGPDHPSTIVLLANLGAVFEKSSRFAEAEEVFARLLGTSAFGPGDLAYGVFLRRHGKALMELGRFREAAADLERAEACFVGLDDAAQIKNVRGLLATLYDRWNAGEPGQGHDAAAERWRKLLADQGP